MSRATPKSYWRSADARAPVRKFDRMMIAGLLLVASAVSFSNDGVSDERHGKAAVAQLKPSQTDVAASATGAAGQATAGGHVRIAMRVFEPNAMPAAAFEDETAKKADEADAEPARR